MRKKTIAILSLVHVEETKLFFLNYLPLDIVPLIPWKVFATVREKQVRN